MTADQVSRLCKRTFDHAKNQNARSAKRSNQVHDIRNRKRAQLTISNQSNSKKRSHKRPKMFPKINQGFTVKNVSGFAVAALNFFHVSDFASQRY